RPSAAALEGSDEGRQAALDELHRRAAAGAGREHEVGESRHAGARIPRGKADTGTEAVGDEADRRVVGEDHLADAGDEQVGAAGDRGALRRGRGDHGSVAPSASISTANDAGRGSTRRVPSISSSPSRKAVRAARNSSASVSPTRSIRTLSRIAPASSTIA